MNKALLGSPWVHRNNWMVLQRWERGKEVEEMDFTKAKIWVQLWGLPPHCKTQKMGQKIGSIVGEVHETRLVEVQGIKGSIVKALVMIQINNPIKGECHAGSKQDGVFWIDFKYERLPQVCYRCGIIGHDDTDCKQNEGIPETTENGEPKQGPWVRAASGGRTLEWTTKNTRGYAGRQGPQPNHNNQIKKVLSEDLLLKLGHLSVGGEREVEAQHPKQQLPVSPQESRTVSHEDITEISNALGKLLSKEVDTEKVSPTQTVRTATDGNAEPKVTMLSQEEERKNNGKQRTWKRENTGKLSTDGGKNVVSLKQQEGKRKMDAMEIDSNDEGAGRDKKSCISLISTAEAGNQPCREP